MIMENSKHSKKGMASYGCAKALNEFFNSAFFAFNFFFYEVEIGLSVWYVGLALIIFAIWNAINDPLAGNLTDRPFRFTKKWVEDFHGYLLEEYVGFLVIYSYLFHLMLIRNQVLGSFLLGLYSLLVFMIHLHQYFL